ncbi:hypothetical protein DFP73DRAFT_620969 [Morchella snyderi]|nr:hypothetical protein DFP73DRAFT_620969 [Morchella snyderi]
MTSVPIRDKSIIRVTERDLFTAKTGDFAIIGFGSLLGVGHYPRASVTTLASSPTSRIFNVKLDDTVLSSLCNQYTSSSPDSEASNDGTSVPTGVITPDNLALQQNLHGATRSSSTTIPQLESSHNKPQVINATQRAVEQRASLFGPTVVKGCRSVESLRKRVARMPSLDLLPENGTERGCPEIEIEGMNQSIGDEEYLSMMLVVPEISRVVQPLSMQELRHMTIMLHGGYGRVETPTDIISDAERLKTVIRKKGFEITGFKLDEKENKISVSLLKKELSAITNKVSSSSQRELVMSSEQVQVPATPSTRLLQARLAPQQRSFGPRLRNAITMSNLRAKARESEGSTPLYPSQRLALRPSASNGALLSSRPTIRAVQPSPVISESPGRFASHKDNGVLTRSSPLNMGGENSPERQTYNQLTERNLRIQERLGPLRLREGSEADIDLQRAQALDRTLKFGEELLQKIDKDNAEDRAQLIKQAGTLETTYSSTTDNTQVRTEGLGLTSGGVTQYTDGDDISGLSCTGSSVSRSQIPNTASVGLPRAGRIGRDESISGPGVVPRTEVASTGKLAVEEDAPISRHSLRPFASMADIRSRNKEPVVRPFSRAAVEPRLTPYRSFPVLPAATNLIKKENRVRTPFNPTGKNAGQPRPTTSQSNKQGDQPAGAKRPPGGFGRELKWA